MLTELCRTCGVDYGDVIEQMLCFIKRTIADDQPPPTDSTKLRLLSVQQFIYLEIPVTDFQETDMFQIHRAHYAGTKAFCISTPRNDWV